MQISPRATILAYEPRHSAQWNHALSQHHMEVMTPMICRTISNIRGTKFQNLNVFHLLMQLSLPNPLKPGVK